MLTTTTGAPEETAMQAGEKHTCRQVAFVLLLLLPWMLLFARAGAEICTAGIGLLFLWRSAAMRDWHWLRDPVVVVAFVAWAWLMLVVSPLAIAPEKSFMLALPWIRYMLLFVAMREWLLTTRPALQKMGAMLAVILAFCVVDTLWQYATGMSLTQHAIWETGRLTGPLLTPKIGIFIARFLLPTLAIFAMLSIDQPRMHAALLFLGALVGIITILLTGERTAFVLSMLALALVVGLLALCEKQARVWIGALTALVVAAMLLLLQTQPWVQETLLRTVAHLEDFSNSPYGQVFAAALHTGGEHWITGVGVQGLRELMPPATQMLTSADPIREHFLHAHNPYLEWFAEAGVGGLVLLVALVACLLREALQLLLHVRGLAALVPAFMIGTCVFHFFPVMSTQSYFGNWTAIMVWYSLGAVFSTRALLVPDDFSA